MSIGLQSHFTLHSHAHKDKHRRHSSADFKGGKSSDWDNLEHDVRAKIKDERKQETRADRENAKAWQEDWDNLDSSKKRELIAWACEENSPFGLYEFCKEHGDIQHVLRTGEGYKLAQFYQEKAQSLTGNEQERKALYSQIADRVKEADQHCGLESGEFYRRWNDAITDGSIDPVTTNALSLSELYSRKHDQFAGLICDDLRDGQLEAQVDSLQNTLDNLPEDKQIKLAAKSLADYMEENFLLPSSSNTPHWMTSFIVKNDLEKGRGYKYKEKITTNNEYMRNEQAQYGQSTFILALLEKFDAHNGLTPDAYAAAMERRAESDQQSKVMEKIGEELITAANEEEDY